MTAIYKTAAGRALVEARYRDLLARWPVAAIHHRLPTSQGETFVLECGPAGAPPLVLLQGSGANAAMWRRDVAVFAERFRVLAVDVIGEPGFSAPSRPPLRSEAYAAWLDDVLDGLRVPRAAFAGVSLGGFLALDYATRRPSRVTAVTLVSASGIGRARRSFLWKALPLLCLGSWGRRRAMRIALGPAPSTVTDADREIGAFSATVFAHFRPRIGAVPIVADDALRALPMPLQVIAGANDALLDSADTARRVTGALPHADVIVLPATGHLVRDQAVRIREFLARAVQSAAAVA